jgi:predicted amidophosphoribosyltransferase
MKIEICNCCKAILTPLDPLEHLCAKCAQSLLANQALTKAAFIKNKPPKEYLKEWLDQ